MSTNDLTQPKLTKNLSPLGAWAFAIGTSIGWGSLVVTNKSYLGVGGPLGSVIGMVIGAIVMLIISKNYAYLISAYPDSGGAYTYSKETFGYDHGFLTAWFLALTYLAILWANVLRCLCSRDISWEIPSTSASCTGSSATTYTSARLC